MAKNMREKTARIAENKDRRPRAVAKHIRISPYKVRVVLDIIRGKSYTQAVAILENTPKSASEPIKKVLEQGLPARIVKLTPEQELIAKNFHFLTRKPLIYVANLSESEINDPSSNKNYRDLCELAEKENTIVVDVASVKEKKYKKYKFEFILSHPMAGSEKSGFNAADENLFVGAKWLVEKENKILEKIIKDTGAISLKFDMKKHNLACAQISHLPAILSFLLYDCASDDSKQIASSGFRDTTRLAMTNSDLVFSMFKNNEENILKTFDLLTKKLNRLKNLSDNERIKLFEAIAQNRAKMYDKNGKNIFKI